jgi:O-antigen/teichoic acid export membrane protein
MSGLKEKAFAGSVAMGGATAVVKVIGVASSILLARLLDPADFGTIALVYAVLNIVNLLAPLGLGAALVQRQENKEDAAFHVFVATTVLAVVFFLVVNISGGYITALLGDHKVLEIFPWMSLLILLNALAQVPGSIFEKDLDFQRLGLIMIVSEIGYVVSAVSLAALGFGVWSLVYSSLGRATVGLVLNWALSRNLAWLRPRRWDWKITGELMSYGFRILWGMIVYYLYSNIDTLIVGRELGVKALGYYNRAFEFSRKTVDEANRTIRTVLFPAYSAIQHDRPRLSRAYVKTLRTLASFTVPASMFIFSAADVLVETLFGERWLPMVPLLQIFAVGSMMKALASTTGAVFNACGFPELNLRAAVLVTLVLLPAIWLLLPYGATGVAFAVSISYVAGFVYNVYQMNTLLPGTWAPMLTASLPAAGGTILMMIAMEVARTVLGSVLNVASPILTLLGLSLAAMLTYGVFLRLAQRELVREVVELVKRTMSRRFAVPD